MKTNYWKKHSNRSWAISTKWQRIANWGQCSEIKSEPNFLGNSNACQQIASWHWTIQLPDQDTLCEIIIVWPLCVTNGSQSVLLSVHRTPSPLHEIRFVFHSVLSGHRTPSPKHKINIVFFNCKTQKSHDTQPTAWIRIFFTVKHSGHRTPSQMHDIRIVFSLVTYSGQRTPSPLHEVRIVFSLVERQKNENISELPIIYSQSAIADRLLNENWQAIINLIIVH